MSQNWEKKSEIEFNSEVLQENEEKMNTLCLFKEHTCFLKTKDAKINLKYTRKNQI